MFISVIWNIMLKASLMKYSNIIVIAWKPTIASKCYV